MNPAGHALSDDNRRTLVKLSIVASLMFGFGYAMVPFYKQICLALGLNSLVPVATATKENTQVDFARTSPWRRSAALTAWGGAEASGPIWAAQYLPVI